MGPSPGAKTLRVRDLAHHPLVMLRDGYDMREVVLTAMRRERIEPHVAIEGRTAVLSFVEAGLGVAVMPSMVVEGRPRLRRITFLPPGMSRIVGLAHRRDVEPSASAQAFRSVLYDHLAEEARSGTLPRGVEIVARSPRKRE